MQPASATRNDAIPSVGSEVLAEGLMLVRASTLKVIRLQLAMERPPALGAICAIYATDGNLLTRATPRMLDGIEEVCAALNDARARTPR